MSRTLGSLRTKSTLGMLLGSGVDLVSPVIDSVEVGNVADDKIVLTYDELLDVSSTPATGDFALSGTAETIASVLVLGRTVTLTLSGDIDADDTVLMSYTAGVNPIRDRSENDAVNLVNQAVTNNVSAGSYLRDPQGNLILDPFGNPIPEPY